MTLLSEKPFALPGVMRTFFVFVSFFTLVCAESFLVNVGQDGKLIYDPPTSVFVFLLWLPVTYTMFPVSPRKKEIPLLSDCKFFYAWSIQPGPVVTKLFFSISVSKNHVRQCTLFHELIRQLTCLGKSTDRNTVQLC